LKEKVIKEINRMEGQYLITREEAMELVSVMVAVKKKDRRVRICIDPVHLNKALLRPHHPMKTVEQGISDVPDVKLFFMLDAKFWFWQSTFDEASKLTNFLTPGGRYHFLRMPCGISTGREVFQEVHGAALRRTTLSKSLWSTSWSGTRRAPPPDHRQDKSS
jgi:hypothetical protein